MLSRTVSRPAAPRSSDFGLLHTVVTFPRDRYNGTMLKQATSWITRKCVADDLDVNDVRVRARCGALEAWISIVLNLALFLVKGAMGLLLNSVALIADAIHTLSDTGTSIVILIGFKITKRPADREHPFGHGRMESVTALIVSIVLILTGVELVKSAVARTIDPTVSAERITWWIAAILLGTMILKELLARFAYELGRIIQSKTLEADAWHHRSDVFSTLLVLVAMVGARFGQAYVDGVAGIVVGLIVIYSGVDITRKAVGTLLGEPPSPQLLRDIATAARSLPGVHGVHDVIVHRYGQVNLASLHIEVLDSEPAAKLHDLSEQVEQIVGEKIAGSAVVHIDPLNKNHQWYDEIEAIIKKQVARDDRILSFHDLRILGHKPRIKAAFDVVVHEQVKEHEIEAIRWQLNQRLATLTPHVRWTVKAEPRYAYSRQIE